MSDFVSNYVREYTQKNTNDAQIKNIVEYIESDWGLNFSLRPVQKFILKCFYGLDLDKVNKTIKIYDDVKSQLLYEFTEVEYLYYLINEGRINVKEISDIKKHKNTLILVCGRRSGKSLITAGIASYETYKLLNLPCPQETYKIRRNAKISITCVATGKEQAGEVFDEIKSHYNDVPFFKQHLANNAAQWTSFKTKYDSKNSLVPSIHVKVKGCQAKGLRGAANYVAIMDEIAHFIQEAKSDASDEAVYKAVAPSTATFNNPNNPEKCDGKVIMISSPLGRSGVFWNEYMTNMDSDIEDSGALVIQAPTWEVNPDINASKLKKNKLKDPSSFVCEYGAQFTDTITNWIEDREVLLQCIDEKLKPKEKGYMGIPHYIGIDLGFSSDGTAIAIGHVSEDGRIELDFHRIIRPDDPNDSDFLNLDLSHKKPTLDTEKIVEYIAELGKYFHIKHGIFDQKEGYSFEQSLARRNLKQIRLFQMSEKKKSDMYQKFKRCLMDQKLRLYYDEFMVKELLHLQRKVVGEYLTRVSKPSTGGYKDDLSDALVRMVHCAYEHMDEGIKEARVMKTKRGRAPRYGLTPKSYAKNRARYRNYINERPKF